VFDRGHQHRADQVRSSVEYAAESARWNPRRWLARRGCDFAGHRVLAHGLRRLGDPLRTTAGNLSYVDNEERSAARGAAGVLAEVSGAAEVFGRLHSPADLDRLDEVTAHLDSAAEECRRLGEQVAERRRAGPGEWLTAEALHIDLRRMVHECARTRDELAELRGVSR